MPYEFGEVVLVRFPFTSQTASKQRPAVVISNKAYSIARPDAVIMAITSQLHSPSSWGEVRIGQWQAAIRYINPRYGYTSEHVSLYSNFPIFSLNGLSCRMQNPPRTLRHVRVDGQHLQSASRRFGSNRARSQRLVVKGQNGEADKLVAGGEETFTHRGCQMIVTIKDNRAAQTSQSLYGDEIEKLNLGDLNPDSVKVITLAHYGGMQCESYSSEERDAMRMDCDSAEVDVSTHNEAPLIDETLHTVFPNLSGKDHDSVSQERATKTYFLLDDPEYAQRFAKAFRRAIELCGGKPESF
jgi:hypothetical protein